MWLCEYSHSPWPPFLCMWDICTTFDNTLWRYCMLLSVKLWHRDTNTHTHKHTHICAHTQTHHNTHRHTNTHAHTQSYPLCIWCWSASCLTLKDEFACKKKTKSVISKTSVCTTGNMYTHLQIHHWFTHTHTHTHTCTQNQACGHISVYPLHECIHVFTLYNLCTHTCISNAQTQTKPHRHPPLHTHTGT